MPRLLVIDDRDQTVEMCHRHLPQFDYVTRCDRRIPCQVCEERDRGCPLKCAHDYGEAVEVLRGGRQPARPGDPRPALRPARGAAAARGQVGPAHRAGGAQRRRSRGCGASRACYILERLRRGLPERAGGHADHHRRRAGRRRARPIRWSTSARTRWSTAAAWRRDHPRAGPRGEAARGRRVLGQEPGHGRAAAVDRRPGPLAAAGAGRGGDRHRQELPRRARHPPALGREGAAGGHRSVDHPRHAAARPPVRRAAGRLHRRGRGSRRGVRAGPRRARSSSTRSPTWIWICSGSCCWCSSAGRSPGWATAGRARRRPSWWPPPTRTWRRWSGRGGSAATSTCGSTRPPGCACRRCASGWTTSPELVRFCLLEALRSPGLRPLVRQYLARFPTPHDFREEENAVRLRAAVAARGAPGRLHGVPQPGGAGAPGRARLAGQRARAAAVRHQRPGARAEPRTSMPRRGRAATGGRRGRAPRAILALSDALVDRLLERATAARPGGVRPARGRRRPGTAAGGWRSRCHRGQLRPHLGGGGAAVPAGAVPRRAAAISSGWPRELFGPARHRPAGPPAPEPARPEAARAARRAGGGDVRYASGDDARADCAGAALLLGVAASPSLSRLRRRPRSRRPRARLGRQPRAGSGRGRAGSRGGDGPAAGRGRGRGGRALRGSAHALDPGSAPARQRPRLRAGQAGGPARGGDRCTGGPWHSTRGAGWPTSTCSSCMPSSPSAGSGATSCLALARPGACWPCARTARPPA